MMKTIIIQASGTPIKETILELQRSPGVIESITFNAGVEVHVIVIIDPKKEETDKD